MEAKASLMSAEAKLQQDESGATPQTIALDKNAIADDETAVQQAKQAYQLPFRPTTTAHRRNRQFKAPSSISWRPNSS